MVLELASSGAGHGGKKTNTSWADPGAWNKALNITEADFTREINRKFLAHAKVTDTTDNSGKDSNDNLYLIASKINKAKDGIALSHHLNAAESATATGVEVLYGSSADKPLAAQISALISKRLGIPDRGAKDGTWLYLARNTTANKHVLLIEWAFVTNPSDMARLKKNLDAVVKELAELFGFDGGKQTREYIDVKSPIGTVTALVDLPVFKKPGFSNSTRSKSIFKKGSTFYARGTALSPTGILRLKIDGGYVSADVKHVKWTYKK